MPSSENYVRDEALNVMTYNIRFYYANDPFQWDERMPLIAAQVLFYEIDVLGVQEPLLKQLQDLSKYLSEYKYIAKDSMGRDHCAIFYKPSRVELKGSGTFWLSENSTRASIGWDARGYRTATWGEFRAVGSGQTFFMFNTHWDYKGKIARRESAKLILSQAEKIASGHPVILTGDFNEFPKRGGIQLLTDKNDPRHFTDTSVLSLTEPFGPGGTYNNFTDRAAYKKPVDYIFVKGKVIVLKHAIFAHYWNGKPPSDHYPVYSKLLFKI